MDWFDLAVTTPQYRPPARPNVLEHALPLNHAPPLRGGPAEQAWQTRLEALPRPLVALLVGANNGTYVLDERAAATLVRRASGFAHSLGGSLLIATCHPDATLAPWHAGATAWPPEGCGFPARI